MSDSFLVRGGAALSGSIAIGGAKNAALKLMVASLLSPGRHEIENVPNILDVEIMGRVLEHVGAAVTRTGTTLTIDVPEIPVPEAPLDLVRQMRASILVLGALLTRTGEARVALPGGDDFGSRPINFHVAGLEAMGATFDLKHGVLHGSAPDGLVGTEVFLEFPSVGATENILLAAVLAEGVTTIGNAAREPELVDLAEYLIAMGAKIDGVGTSTIEIHGVDALTPTTHRTVSDRLEAGTYLVAGAMTAGTVTVTDCRPEHLRMELRKLESTGCTIAVTESTITVTGPERPLPVDIATLPYPGFHTDMHPQLVTLLSIAGGTSLVTENIYAGRFRYLGELNRMGAEIHADGQHVVIRGVDGLSGCEVDACDIRAGAALTIAAMRAEGETLIRDAEHVDRGYDGWVPKLQSLGADIQRV
ncbi:MAG: UDP-N-acetylglucosamine 1-carboxyvinyltransferase [Actinomycetota bacterium]|nr:UDP-N-acetylglucosamine 1-carboxyvinyltransferase [Actinomycetota bacterium]MDK1016189.1 UDP-N-acetylglucosamine 1-carboxyvinyltransferase [Actinomycetota bacterium]MDK1026830.1 UDP-N-acetylglucosamine 1-carboxyvinyltransferase [Actinomycetota bacterium]MDK1037781.1 UDP-N-acetylglucosamine 1-carboxyvinyltransferase [Actinomycetota bacterium]MDK1096255.1 UDP-N-acetylglucosamine 1-carboxyvinyltransferase [Actinomycetota bacterium]